MGAVVWRKNGNLKPLDVTDPRARRTLHARQLLLADKYDRLATLVTIAEQLCVRAAEFEDLLLDEASQLWDDAERLSRYERQQKAKANGNGHRKKSREPDRADR